MRDDKPKPFQVLHTIRKTHIIITNPYAYKGNWDLNVVPFLPNFREVVLENMLQKVNK
jgi:hypothetical protein